MAIQSHRPESIAFLSHSQRKIPRRDRTQTLGSRHMLREHDPIRPLVYLGLILFVIAFWIAVTAIVKSVFN
jgi:hypothetical protein